MKLSHVDCHNVIKELREKDNSMPIVLWDEKGIYVSKSSGNFCLSYNDKRTIDGRNKKFGIDESEVRKMINTKMGY